VQQKNPPRRAGARRRSLYERWTAGTAPAWPATCMPCTRHQHGLDALLEKQ
jgi:hypothetical protein